MKPRSSGAPLVAGMIASGVVHAIVLLSPLRVSPRPTAGDRTDAPTAGIRLVAIAVREEEPGRAPTSIVALPAVASPSNSASSDDALPSDAPAASDAGFRPVADRIGPRIGDARLWERRAIDFDEVSAAERVNARVASGTLKEIADSIAEVQESARRAVDWTVKDDEGDARWGVLPDCLILAGRRRCQRSGRTNAVVERDFVRAALQNAGTRVLIDGRVRAIRGRRDSTRTGGEVSGRRGGSS